MGVGVGVLGRRDREETGKMGRKQGRWGGDREDERERERVGFGFERLLML